MGVVAFFWGGGVGEGRGKGNGKGQGREEEELVSIESPPPPIFCVLVVVMMMMIQGQIMGAMKSHQSDPHLSKEDNAVALADKVQGASGTTSYEQALLNTSTILARDFLPKGDHLVFVAAPARVFFLFILDEAAHFLWL